MKRTYIIGGLVVVALIIIVVVIQKRQQPAPAAENQNETSSMDVVEVEESEDATATTTTSTPATTPASRSGSGTTGTSPKSATAAYLKARDTYQDSGFYFQFLNCHGLPGSLTMKKGTKFMLDNRDNATRKIVIDKKTYTLGAYGYAIATAPLKIGTYYITCNGGGAASISVQQ